MQQTEIPMIMNLNNSVGCWKNESLKQYYSFVVINEENEVDLNNLKI